MINMSSSAYLQDIRKRNAGDEAPSSYMSETDL